jgi:hypothetical protein
MNQISQIIQHLPKILKAKFNPPPAVSTLITGSFATKPTHSSETPINKANDGLYSWSGASDKRRDGVRLSRNQLIAELAAAARINSFDWGDNTDTSRNEVTNTPSTDLICLSKYFGINLHDIDPIDTIL